MKKVERYARPSSLEAALKLKEEDRGAAWLAGGTFLLAGDGRDKPESVIDVGAFIPGELRYEGEELVVGAGATFQELLESRLTPPLLAEAAAGMANRNIRDRATVGGNLGANRSCSSLIPALLVSNARVEIADCGSKRLVPLAPWLEAPKGLVLSLRIPREKGRRSACGRWARTACDLSILTAAVSLNFSEGRAASVRVAMGGLGPRARRFPELESLFEGRPIPPAAEIEAMASPLFEPMDDLRGGAEFKRLRAAALLADVAREARGQEALS